MADDKKVTPFFTTEMVTLFAPKGAKFHATAGQEVKVQARQKEKFLKLGYKETAAEALDAEAHPAIAAVQPKAVKAKAEPVKEPTA